MSKVKQYPKKLFTLEEARQFIKDSLLKQGSFKGSQSTRYIPVNLLEDIKNLSRDLGLISENVSEQLLWIYKNYREYPKRCLTCGNYITDFESFNQEYKSNYCSTNCLNNNLEVKEKKKQTSKRNFGTDFPCQSEIYQNRMKTVYLEKYGVEHPMQNKQVFQKSLKGKYKKKDYILPSSKIIKVQGNEPEVINYLLKFYKEDELEFNNIPNFKYKSNYYFPDVYIPKDNLIIEVKSEYTYKVELKKNLLKKKAVISNGYNFKFYIYDRKSKQIIIL